MPSKVFQVANRKYGGKNLTQSAIKPGQGFGLLKMLMIFFSHTKFVCFNQDPFPPNMKASEHPWVQPNPQGFFIKKGWMWTTLTCSQSTIRLANGGLNCQVCCNDKPSMSKMTWAPATWVAGSIMAASRNITAPLYTSSNEHFLCFHLSENWIKQD